MSGDFNIRDNLWDPLYPHHLSHSDDFFIITDSFNLGLSIPTNQVPTRCSNNFQDANLVLDLIFLHFGSSELNNHVIHPEWRLTSDHAPLTITIPIVKEYIQTKKHTTIKYSEKEHTFVKKLIEVIRNIDTDNIFNVDHLYSIVLEFSSSIENIWAKNSKFVNIMKYSKSWWDMNCNRDLDKYKASKYIEDWKQFKKTVKNMKHTFFNLKIQEISNKQRGPWKLMNWVNKCKLPAVETVKYNSWLYFKINHLWHTLHSLFNMAQDHQINAEILDEFLSKVSLPWIPFLEEEFISSITKCNNLLTLGPNKLSWRHLKSIIKNKACLKEIINIANTYFELGHWPFHFKTSITIIIPKPNKKLYYSPKSFRPIILLNTLGKHFEKFISEHLQFHMISNNFIYKSQLGKLKHRLTSDAGIALTHFIYMG